jgi:hypothetical protein
MLEQSVYADDLRPDSVVAMHALARQLWSTSFHAIVREATAMSERDRGNADADQRLRIGMYFYTDANRRA